MEPKNAVFISGTWDLFHIGHLRILQKAKSLGDYLVVGVVTDEFAQTYKEKPVILYKQRREIVNGLECVDVVIPHPYANYVGMIEDYNITIRVVGPEFGILAGQREFLEFARTHGLKVVVIPRTPDISTTIIKRRIRNE